MAANVDQWLLPEVTSIGQSMNDSNGCPIVNITQQQERFIYFCKSPEWKDWLENGTLPNGTGYENEEYGNVYILCENIFQPNTKIYEKIMKLFLMLALVFLMMGLGVTMEPNKIVKHAMRPVGATVATVVQFGIMPFLCWGLAIIFKMNEIKMISMVILGCCPGGTISNFMALVLRGDMNLSILMTSVSTVVGVVAIPGMIKLISGFFLDECTNLTVNPMKIVIPLLFTLGPCCVGMVIKAKTSEATQNKVLQLGKVMMVVGIVAITVANGLIFRSSVFLYFPRDIMISCALVPLAGFIIGFVCSWAVCEKPRARRTIMLETGLKNAQICLAILVASFPIEKIGVLEMMPLYFLFFQAIESVLLAFLFTKVLGIQDEEVQEKILEYDDIEKSSFQRQISLKLAKKTNTPVGLTNRSGTTYSCGGRLSSSGTYTYTLETDQPIEDGEILKLSITE